jgi:hypothetical protein
MSKVGKISSRVKEKQDPRSKHRIGFQIPWNYNFREAFKVVSKRIRLQTEGRDRDGNMADLARRILEQYIFCMCTEEDIEHFGLANERSPVPTPFELRDALNQWMESGQQKQKLLVLKKGT